MLRFQSHLPITFWGECILTTIHIINRLPTLLLHKKTSFEILYKKPPDYSRMRVFGCITFATIVNPSSKFSPRATKCIFLGYPIGQKAYKLYNISTRKIFTNRNVVFLEDTFHHYTKTLSTPSALPIPLSLEFDLSPHLSPKTTSFIDSHPLPPQLRQLPRH